MPQELQCGHTCSGCRFTTSRKKDLTSHEGAGRPHRACNEACPRYLSLKKPSIRVYTQDSYLTPQHSQPGSASSSRASSVSGTSSRKRSREPTEDDDLEVRLQREKLERFRVMERLTICCVLDPLRREKSFEDVDGVICWPTWEHPSAEVLSEKLAAWPMLEGYVFRDPHDPRAVRIYDWVSFCVDRHAPSLTR